MWEGKRLRHADCASGIGWVALGGLVLYKASQMPIGGVYAGVDNPWYASPAAFPILLGMLLIVSGVRVFLHGVRGGGLPGIGASARRALCSLVRPPALRGLLVVLLIGFYYLLLRLRLVPGWEGQNYMVSSALFLSGFALCFHQPEGRFPRPALVFGMLAVAALIAWAVAKLFSGPLGVPLP